MPYNATIPTEWDQMTRAQKKAWRLKHWRPHEWMVEVPLKREATRMAKRADKRTRRGGGMDLGGLARAMGL